MHETDGSDMTLTWPPCVRVQGNILCPTLSVNQKDSYKERIPQNTLMRTPIRKILLNQGNDFTKYAHEDSYKEKTSKPRKRCQPSTTIKALKPSLTKVYIIYLSSSTLEL